MGTAVHELTVPIYPASFAVQFPEYVPVQIRSDYEEAYAILSISPKASATLSRRCLQGMIHDFWDIHEKKSECGNNSFKTTYFCFTMESS